VLRDHGTSAADVDLVKTLPSYFVVLSVIFGKVLDMPSVTLDFLCLPSLENIILGKAMDTHQL
jgi:hypothetical protein